jgi:tetratricopeptide (TPR) repeat protein
MTDGERKLDGTGTRLGIGDRTFDAAELAEFCGVPLATLRRWQQRGLLAAGRLPGERFPFRATGQVRALAQLWRAGWTVQRIERALARARTVVPDPEQALLGLLAAIGQKRLVVLAPDGRLLEPGGQLLFDWQQQKAELPTIRSAQDWFAIGVDAEAAGRFDEAIRAYQHALPTATADVHFNLGNCYYTQRRLGEAATQFSAAVAKAPDFAEVWNNLGVVRGDLGDRQGAIAALQQALRVVPHYADAHYNLADALAVVGDLPGAIRHWRAYLTYDPNSRWAEQVKKRLSNHDSSSAS